MIHAALFDLDGVVLDTESQYTRFWAAELDRLSPGEGMDLAHRIKGSTLVQIFDRYYKGDTEVQRAVEQRLNDFERKMDYGYIPGFESFILSLRKCHFKTAIVTSSNLAKMENVFGSHPELKGWFDAILTSEDFKRSKPDPECYLKASARFGLSPAECLGFEDSVNGLEALNAAHIRTVGLATTNARELVARYADVVIDDYRNVDLQVLLA